LSGAVRSLFRVLLVLWAGSLWSLVWVAWTLFHVAGNRHLAGAIAAPLFSIETYLGAAVAAGAVLLPGRGKMSGVFAAALLLGVNEFILKRLMEAAQARGAFFGLTFGAWHGVSAVLYLIACVGLLSVIWKQDFR
jgi:hypothetical protein